MAISTDPKLNKVVKDFVKAGRKSQVFKLADFTSQGYRNNSGIDRTVTAFAKYPNTPHVWSVKVTESTTAYFIGNSIDEVVTRLGQCVPVTHKPLSEKRLMRVLALRMKAFRNTLQERLDQMGEWPGQTSDVKRQIADFREILSRELDTMPRFKQAISDTDKIWSNTSWEVSRFFAETAGKYTWTPELVKKAWNFANNNPVEGLK
jgi:hypothetical protein